MKTRHTLFAVLGLSALLAGGQALADGWRGKCDNQQDARCQMGPKDGQGQPGRGHKEPGKKRGGRAADVALQQSKISAAQAIATAEKETDARAYELDVGMHREQPVFEVELHDGKQEYAVRVHGVTGEIVARKSEVDDSAPKNAAVTLTQAIEIAETALGSKVVDIELDTYSNALAYEVRLLKADGIRQYAFVDAQDGKVLDSGDRPARAGKRPDGAPGQQPVPAPAAPAAASTAPQA